VMGGIMGNQGFQHSPAKKSPSPCRKYIALAMRAQIAHQ
jgi:hypothetical protein